MSPRDPDRAADSSAETVAASPEELRAQTVRFTPGTLLAGRYRIVAPLGKGGMGEVYRADDIRLGQPVALKFLPAALAAQPGRIEHLHQEVRIGRQVSHPNVCRLYDISEAEGHHFLVMEYVDGEDLASLLHRIGRLPADKALEIARGLCAGLAAAHDKGVIHRDMKPANVMIDGPGHGRIADFGLATLASGGRAGGLAGTLVYMAPEQLAGESASLRSDVYALGLVLFEMFTGQRAFDAKSLDELKALHAEAKPKSLSSSARDMDPAVERVVLRCLARDPADRPASARAVLAALPGGDPLEAAVLAGETPSPEMVAAAAIVGDLRVATAWACLVAALAGLILVAFLAGRTRLFRIVPLPKSPEALTERARDVLARLGYDEPPADSAYGFDVDTAFLDHLERHDRSPGRWETLRTARPGPFVFYYRQSPSPLIASSWTPGPPWLAPMEQIGRVTRSQPPANTPGMAEVALDPRGRLVSLRVVPQRLEARDGPWPAPDWSALFAEAGLDPAAFRPAPLRWPPPVGSDQRAAWDGTYAGQPTLPVHVEAAAHGGRPVSFEVKGPWADLAAPSRSAEPGSVILATAAYLAGVVVLMAASIVVGRRNLRLGRGDRRGAFRLAMFSFVTVVLAFISGADHSLAPSPEYALLMNLLPAISLYYAWWLWFIYMAMEPAVRRRWPHTLVSWSRLLAGRFTDPLVGRDVLLGGLAGLLLLSTWDLTVVVPAWLGKEAKPYLDTLDPAVAGSGVLSTLGAPRQLAYFSFEAPSSPRASTGSPRSSFSTCL